MLANFCTSCSDEETRGFMINRNVIFDKTALLADRQREDAIATSDHSNKEYEVTIEVNTGIKFATAYLQYYAWQREEAD